MARTILPGGAFSLDPLPPGVPFAGHLLVADRGAGRIFEVDAQGNVTWAFPVDGDRLPAPFYPPDDAFYSTDLRMIVANAEESHVVTAIDYATRKILWQVGAPLRPGRGLNQFNTPDDAVPGLDGRITVADIKNCRLVLLSPEGDWLSQLGNGQCRHDPPRAYSSPNGAFPAADGSLIVTEINGSWVDWLNQDRTVKWAVRSSTVYPSDAIPLADGSVLLTDFANPGQVLRMASDGTAIWRYRPSGAGQLNHPSIALPLARNRVAISDDWNGRVLVVDPGTNEVVWQIPGKLGVRLVLPDGLAYRPS